MFTLMNMSTIVYTVVKDNGNYISYDNSTFIERSQIFRVYAGRQGKVTSEAKTQLLTFTKQVREIWFETNP